MVATSIQQFEDILKASGVHAALAFLNQRVPYRFTAIYRLGKDELEIIELIDKLNEPATAPQRRVPFFNSFCEVVIEEGSLVTSNSVLETKLAGRTHQGLIISYVGLPLLDNDGRVFGTLCHCDYIEQLINDEEFDFLQQAVMLFPKSF